MRQALSAITASLAKGIASFGVINNKRIYSCQKIM